MAQNINWHGQGLTPFADHMAACGGGVQSGVSATNMFSQAGSFQTVSAQCMNPQFSNVTKNSTIGLCTICMDLMLKMATRQ